MNDLIKDMNAEIAELQAELGSANETLTEWATVAKSLGLSCNELKAEVERLRLRVLTAAGDDLCRLTPEEIKELTSGAVKIPPEEEFLASCKRFHGQIANTSGVLGNCLTLAQMIAENERLRFAAIGHHSAQEYDVLAAELRVVEEERDRLKADAAWLRIELEDLAQYSTGKCVCLELRKLVEAIDERMKQP